MKSKLLLAFGIACTILYAQDENEKSIPKSDFKGVPNVVEKRQSQLQQRQELIEIAPTGGGKITLPTPVGSSSSLRWLGANNSSSIAYRTGITGVGLTNPPTDTKLYVKANNLKVGIVSEVSHTQDYKFGILSAVNRPNTKAFSVLLKQGSNYVDKFAVMGDGRAFATEFEVRTTIFPDYVFDESYDLISIDNLKRFIDENHHLPNVPKAEKVISEGQKIGELQRMQFEKIEELTLYIIELNEKIKKLNKEVQELKKETK